VARGEASRARDRFKALAPGERLALTAFLKALSDAGGRRSPPGGLEESGRG
jgi:hypothetical protein